MASAHVILKYINQTKIKGGCQSGRKMVPPDSKSDLPLATDTHAVPELLLCVYRYVVV